MPFIASEDVGTTPRRSLSARRRLQAWERTKGVCVICEAPIDGVRERWIIEHIRALELGGPDDLTNMGPAHEACGRTKTRDDHARTAKAKRQKIQHLGAAEPSRPLPGSRGTLFKRKINGRVILREEQCDRKSTPRPRSSAAPKIVVHASPSRAPAACTPTQPSGMVNECRTEVPMPSPRTERERTTDEVPAPRPSTTGTILPAVAPDLSILFDDKPLLAGESAERYDGLLATIIHQVRPKDAIEALWAKNIVDLIWEANRLRRWRGEILDQARLEAAMALILPVLQDRDGSHGSNPRLEVEAQAVVIGWLKGEKGLTINMERLLRYRRATLSDITARAFQIALPDIERIDRMIAAADARRDGLLREIERKRASLGQQLRAAATEVIDIAPIPEGEGARPPERG